MSEDLEYNIRTVGGLLLIIAGLTGGISFGWWLIFVGNIIEILHSLKLGLPGWGWTLLKVGLAACFALLFVTLFALLALMVFSGGKRKRT